MGSLAIVFECAAAEICPRRDVVEAAGYLESRRTGHIPKVLPLR
jgi:hypothetical protein